MRVVLSSFSSSLGERGVHRYFYLALFCDVCSTSLLPRGKGFVLFNGRLFSHLLSARICVQENIRTHAHTHTLFSFFLAVYIDLCAYENYERDTQFHVTLQTKGLSLSFMPVVLFLFSTLAIQPVSDDT